jgi:hypothetical protein
VPHDFVVDDFHYDNVRLELKMIFEKEELGVRQYEMRSPWMENWSHQDQ